MAYDASVYPYDAVVRITDTIGGQSWQGSGVLISPDEVLTASHVLYIDGAGSATNITVTPGYSPDSSPYGSASAANIHYFEIDDADDLITNEQSQTDYALIHLSSPFEDVRTMGLEANFSGGTVNITGYPASAGGDQVTSTQTDSVDPNYTLLDGTSIGAGSSGGPVWVETASGPDVVGLVSSIAPDGTGYSVQITTSVLNQIEAWVAQDDGSGASWKVVGAGDFTGDGTSDVLLQNGGAVVDWIMNNGLYQSGNVLTAAAAGWTVVGTGDFTGNGTVPMFCCRMAAPSWTG